MRLFSAGGQAVVVWHQCRWFVKQPPSKPVTSPPRRLSPGDEPTTHGRVLEYDQVLAEIRMRDDLQAPPGSRARGRAATLVDADLAPGPDELGERSHDLRRRLLRQVKQGHRRSIGRYRVLMQAATIRRGRRRRWLLLSDNLGSVAPSGSTAPFV